ncbi:MAG: hypothetical protein HN842_04590 [Gammaproteobacteria bacterium]|jgi:hypothetical protein|nr:hypothetical protein [Gammaproteobacteria bacterium]
MTMLIKTGYPLYLLFFYLPFLYAVDYEGAAEKLLEANRISYPLDEITAASHQETLSNLSMRLPLFSVNLYDQITLAGSNATAIREVITKLLSSPAEIGLKSLRQLINAGGLLQLKSESEKAHFITRIYRSRVESVLFKQVVQKLSVDLNRNAILYRMLWADYHDPLQDCCPDKDYPRAELFRFMIEQGADPRWRIKGSQQTLLHILVNRNFVDLDKIRILMEYGLSPDSQDSNGLSALALLNNELVLSEERVSRLTIEEEEGLHVANLPDWYFAPGQKEIEPSIPLKRAKKLHYQLEELQQIFLKASDSSSSNNAEK